MAQSNHSALGQGLKLYTDGMRRFVKGRLIAAFPNNWWKSGVLDMLPRRQQDSLNYELSKTPNIDKAELIGVGEIEQVVTRHFDHVFKDFPTTSGFVRGLRRCQWRATRGHIRPAATCPPTMSPMTSTPCSKF